jgi:hypothetical protein
MLGVSGLATGGFCFPSSCNDADVSIITVLVYYPYLMGRVSPAITMDNVTGVACLEEPQMRGPAAIVTITLMVFILICVISGM